MINTVHWNESDSVKADCLRNAAEKLADEQRDAPAEKWNAVKRDRAEQLEAAIRETDESTLARLVDILKGEK